jgi:hypothetical protein
VASSATTQPFHNTNPEILNNKSLMLENGNIMAEDQNIALGYVRKLKMGRLKQRDDGFNVCRFQMCINLSRQLPELKSTHLVVF